LENIKNSHNIKHQDPLWSKMVFFVYELVLSIFRSIIIYYYCFYE